MRDSARPALPAAVVTTILASSALAFGAVYGWARLPLAVAVIGVAAWQWRPGLRPGAVGSAAFLLLAAVAVQLIPIPASLLQVTSPSAVRFLEVFSIGFANGLEPSHAVSIDPALTRTSLLYLVLVVIWAGACRSALSSGLPVRTIAGNVAALGTVVALLGLAQKATFNGKLLWFWTPQFFATNSFGPFVNRNHFAGWMILAVSISIGLLFARGVRSAPSSDATWRERVLWLGSPAASPVMVIAAVVLVMSCSLVWTMSRSGIIGAATALTAIACAAVWRNETASSRLLLAGFVLLIGVTVVTWRGTDRLASLYGDTGTLAWRVQLWKDTAPAVGDYWLTGSGLNTYSSLMMIQPRTDLTVQPRQAHNDYLQLAVEGGLLLTIPALLLIAAVGRAIVRAMRLPQDERTWWIRMGAVAGIIGVAVQEISEFSLQIPAVSLLFATCVAIAIHEADDRTSARKLNRHSQRHAEAA